MHKFSKLMWASVAMLGIIASSAQTQEATFKIPDVPETVPGLYIVKYDPDASIAEQSTLLARENVKIVDTLPLIGAQVVQIEGEDIAFARNLITGLSGVEYVEPVYVVYAIATPNDPRYSEQWGYEKIKAPKAWDTRTDSDGVVVAVIDTGIDYKHPDLAANVWVNPNEIPGNGIDDDHNGIVDDVHGANFSTTTATGDPLDDNRHGTHVAGTIGAVTNNNLGVAGVNWTTKIMGVKFLSASGSGTTVGAIRAIEYAIQMKANITNNSWGGGGFSQALEDAIKKADAAGMLFAAAAGNTNKNNDVDPFYPAGYEVANIISVMATDRNDNKAIFSHYGLKSVDLGAPGVDILSTIPGGNYDSFNGTSMATPHVAGAAALVLAENPSFTVADLKKRLMDTVDVIPALSGLSVTGGRLNLAAAIGLGEVKPDACDKHSARIAYEEFFWSDNRKVDSNTNLLSVDFKLPVAMIVDIGVNGSARRIGGSGDTVFRTGVYSQVQPSTMWTGSYRRGTFVKEGDSRSVSSSFAMALPAGDHTVYWKFWVSGATVQFDSGALTVRAFPCSMGGKLKLAADAAAIDATQADQSESIRNESLKTDAQGNSVTVD